MSTYVIMLIEILLISILVWAIIGLFAGTKAIKQCKKLKIRNQQVYEFRLFVLYNRHDLFECLPSYESMLTDNKPLIISSYFPNLNNKNEEESTTPKK